MSGHVGGVDVQDYIDGNPFGTTEGLELSSSSREGGAAGERLGDQFFDGLERMIGGGDAFDPELYNLLFMPTFPLM